MAGDWLKMTHALPEKPEVLAIAGKTGFNRFEVVGRLFTLWRWFDINTTDGNAYGVTSVTLEECLFGYSTDTNFVSEVLAVRWLREVDDGISVVNFDEHISESAKTRAQTAKRVAKSKLNAKGNAEGNGESVTNSVTKTVPREEKRREEKEHPPKAPKGAASGFEIFWQAYPNKVAKPSAIKAFAKVTEALSVLLAAIEVQKRSEKWTRDKGQYIPMPATWLNNERWNDVIEVASAPASVDPDSRSAIEAEGVAKGIGPWNEINEQWHAYKARVRGKPVNNLGLDALAAMAAQRSQAGAH